MMVGGDHAPTTNMFEAQKTSGAPFLKIGAEVNANLRRANIL